MTRLDRARERFPHFGFAVYALEPGGDVTIEIHMPDVIAKSAATEDEAWDMILGREDPEPAADDVFA